MEKVKLLNNGGYEGLSHIEFPVVVHSHNKHDTYCSSELVEVSAAELNAVNQGRKLPPNVVFLFMVGDECEIIK